MTRYYINFASSVGDQSSRSCANFQLSDLDTTNNVKTDISQSSPSGADANLDLSSYTGSDMNYNFEDLCGLCVRSGNPEAYYCVSNSSSTKNNYNTNEIAMLVQLKEYCANICPSGCGPFRGFESPAIMLQSWSANWPAFAQTQARSAT